MEFLSEELHFNDCKMVAESAQTSEGKDLWITGICMQSTIRNRNGRIYPKTEITEAVNSATQRIKADGGIFGELDHPPTLQINSDRISHVITEMWMSGNDAYAKSRILNTPTGRIAKELFNSGVRIGVSSRGAGSVTESGEVSSFQFQTFDIVTTPSAPNAIATPVYESLDTKQGRRVLTLSEQLQDDPAAQKYFIKEIAKFIETLKG